MRHRQAGVDLTDPAAVRDALLHRFADWSPALRGFITDTDTGYTNRPLFALPVPHSRRSSPPAPSKRPRQPPKASTAPSPPTAPSRPSLT
ncbi:hypothetical protein [Streptomyces sp. NPDC101234]|uniref:hypothetical protein n=1 Tax=Streptomyces sp. NPDC101234 TaxID=3366138 RepID=UPI003811DA12